MTWVRSKDFDTVCVLAKLMSRVRSKVFDPARVFEELRSWVRSETLTRFASLRN